MLSSLDLARRIEAGVSAAAAVVDLCAEAIAGRESEIGAVRMVRSASRLNARRARASGNVALNSVRRRHGVSRRNSGPKIQGTREYAR